MSVREPVTGNYGRRDEYPLTWVFGDNVRGRALDVLVANPDQTFTQSEIAEVADCSQAAVSRATRHMVEIGLVEHNVDGMTFDDGSLIGSQLYAFRERLKQEYDHE